MHATIPEAYLEMVGLRSYLVDSRRSSETSECSSLTGKGPRLFTRFDARRDDETALLQKPNAMSFGDLDRSFVEHGMKDVAKCRQQLTWLES